MSSSRNRSNVRCEPAVERLSTLMFDGVSEHNAVPLNAHDRAHRRCRSAKRPSDGSVAVFFCWNNDHCVHHSAAATTTFCGAHTFLLPHRSRPPCRSLMHDCARLSWGTPTFVPRLVQPWMKQSESTEHEAVFSCSSAQPSHQMRFRKFQSRSVVSFQK